MSILINCKVSLSKKLRNYIEDGGTLTLTTLELKDGKGVGRLSLNSGSQKFIEIPEELKGETSIQLTPVDVSEEMPEVRGFGNIFSSVPEKGKEKSEPVVRKIAAVNAPEKAEISNAIVDRQESDTPVAFSELQSKDCKDYVKNLTELIDAVNIAKNKNVKTIDINAIESPRDRAVAIQEMERAGAIELPAFIINDKVGVLAINDLDISLAHDLPFDLRNISAKRIAASNELRGLIKSGYIKFISPKEKDEYIMKVMNDDAQTVAGLEVYSSHEEAADSIGGSGGQNIKIDTETAIEVTEKDIEKTEDENMILNLTQNMPREITTPAGSKLSTHGTKPGTGTLTQSTPDGGKKTVVKSVRRMD